MAESGLFRRPGVSLHHEYVPWHALRTRHGRSVISIEL